MTIDTKFETVDKGDYCAIDNFSHYIAKNPKDMELMWKEMHSRRSPQPELPTVNFGEEMIIGLYAGEKPHGGYGLEITRLVETEDALEVHVVEKTPEPGMVYTQALIHPYHLVKTTKIDKEVRFIRQT